MLLPGLEFKVLNNSSNTVPNGKTFNNVFDELFRTLNSNPGSNTVHTATPVNIVEADNEYTVSFNAPGRVKEKFKLSVENGLLTVSYDVEPTTEKEHQKVVRNEFTITISFFGSTTFKIPFSYLASIPSSFTLSFRLNERLKFEMVNSFLTTF